jgi:orotate phosphoribosyltransferase
VRPGTNPALLRNILEAAFLPLPRGIDGQSNSGDWSIDMRIPLSTSSVLRPLAAEMIALLEQHNVAQIAGEGLGAFFLVGGIVSAGADLSGGLIRESRKGYGFRKRVEGNIDQLRPAFIVDDILSSGKSALTAAGALREEGFSPVGVLTVFRYGWRDGDSRLRDAGLISESLATLYPLDV